MQGNTAQETGLAGREGGRARAIDREQGLYWTIFRSLSTRATDQSGRGPTDASSMEWREQVAAVSSTAATSTAATCSGEHRRHLLCVHDHRGTHLSRDFGREIEGR
jgi:hypothetical protein